MELDHLQRERFPDGPVHTRLKRVLMTQDGSTTRLCAAIAADAGAALELQLVLQERRDAVPSPVAAALGGGRWLVRITSLHARGQVLMDNLSFTRLDTVPDWFLEELDRGVAPIGKLLDSLYVRREPAPASPEVENLLWDRTGLAHRKASRSYVVRLPEAPLMYIFETWRGAIATL
jgi:chorismate-pyruvate lyase